MDQASIIHDLLHWLESHLDQPLSLDHVAAKAGYSKWHLQRMFKDITGHAIGSYIRGRRLTQAAVALRLTSRPILDIALQYRFDSQQTFTRAFKKQFQRTPAQYRRDENWNMEGICSPIQMANSPLPVGEEVYLEERTLVGVTQRYTRTLEQLAKFQTDVRSQFWHQYLKDADIIPPALYGIHFVRPTHGKDDEQEVFYTTALDPEHLPQHLPDSEPVVMPGGKYLQFHYTGPVEGFQSFLLTLYGTCLPLLKVTRRSGCDIEIFFTQHQTERRTPDIIECNYLISIL